MEEEKPLTKMASCRNVQPTRDWSALPPQTLASFRNRLESSIDAFLFRSVCKNWRFSTNPNSNHSLLSSILPCKISNPTFPFLNHHPKNDALILVSRAVLLVQSYELSNSSWILTVEETTPGKLRILYPLSNEYVTNLPSSFSKYLDLSEFRVSEIAKSYGLKCGSDEIRDVIGVNKIVLCSNCTAMVLYGEGTVVGVGLKTGKWDYLRHSLVTSISDLAMFRGTVIAIDCKGVCYSVDSKTMELIENVAIGNLKDGLERLVEHKGELYLLNVYNSTGDPVIIIYRLDEQQRKWVRRDHGLGVLFMSVGFCFFVHTQDIYGRLAVCSKNYFDSNAKPPYTVKLLFEDSSVKHNLQIGVFNRPLMDRYVSDLKSNKNDIAKVLWPPPTWFWTVTCSIREDEEDDRLDHSNQEVTNQEVLHPSLFAAGSSSGEAAIGNEQDMVTKNNSITMDSIVIGNLHSSKAQDSNSCTSTTSFEGVKIRSNLLPTLQTIWAKQGNILEESRIRNGDLLAKALESLATAFLILKNSSGRSLTKIQADYLDSTLCDLQQMHFKVDWLTPFVEKALAVYKSKPLIDSLKEFDEAKIRAQETKLKVLDELAKLDEVEEDREFIFEKIPVLESVDLDQCLGEGLSAESWSNLPPEILSAIKKRLNSRIDILRCRSVCKNWRAFINPNPNPSILSPFHPRKISNFTLPFNNRPNDPLILFARIVLLIKPLQPSNDGSSWILTVEEVVQGKLRILCPLSKNQDMKLPSNSPKFLNLLDFRVSEIDKSYGFKYASDGKDVYGVNKVILCSGSTVMVLCGEGILIGVRMNKGKWGFVMNSLVTPICDLIRFKGMVYAIDSEKNLHAVDYKKMKVIESIAVNPILSPLREQEGQEGKRLLDQEGKLLLVTWWATYFSKSSVEVTCYNLDELRKEWMPTRLQGCVLFVSLDWCFLVCSRDLGISDFVPETNSPLSLHKASATPISLGNDDLHYGAQSSTCNVVRNEYLVLSLSCFASLTIMPRSLMYNLQWFERASVNYSIGVFYSTDEVVHRRDYVCSSIVGALWPPPIWFWPNTYTSSG
ncbi:F-box protein SKIP23 [Bienertia sinuspersici]